MLRNEVPALATAREKLSALIALYAPMNVQATATNAINEGLEEFEAAVRLDEHDALVFGRGQVPTGTSALDTSEADAIEPSRESTPEELQSQADAEMPSPPMSDEEFAAKEEVDAEREHDEEFPSQVPAEH